MLHDLIVVGAGPAGLALAADARRAGLGHVLVVDPGESAFPPDAPDRFRLDVRLQTPVERIGDGPDDSVVVESGSDSFLARACAVITGPEKEERPRYALPDSLSDRVHFNSVDFPARDGDVLIVASGERAVTLALQLAEAEARVVLALLSRLEDLSWMGREALLDLEYDHRLTVLWDSSPDAVHDLEGFPMVHFSDHSIPELQFDHLVYALPGSGPGVVPAEVSLGSEEAVLLIDEVEGAGRVAPNVAWSVLRDRCFPSLPEPLAPRPVGDVSAAEAHRLRRELYNATITHFDRVHSELWLIRVRPDSNGMPHLPGQYATLGLGFWEPRVDEADEKLAPQRIRQLARRSYSISSRIFDERGYLVDPALEEDLEFYVVLVQADGERIPGLTPRLAAKQEQDRMYIGPKVTGRYSLAPVQDPSLDILFLATGTGEAPHNAMIAELLRKGHHGTILAVVSVRYPQDLAYLATYQRLESRFPNFRYLTLVTREPGRPKRHLQDLLAEGDLEGVLPSALDPARTHVFLCGNPAMIGLPEWEEDTPAFPQPPGACELLHQRGFTLDRRGVVGNVHYEEYW